MHNKYTKIIDISYPIQPNMPVYPGDPEVNFDMHVGQTSSNTKLIFGTHAGTHIDAPRHVFKTGKGIDKVNLNRLAGECRVFDFTRVKNGISITDLKNKGIKEGERILFKTRNSKRQFTKFYSDFVYLEGNAADYLAERRVKMVGIDAFSIKQSGSSDLRAHTTLLKHNIIIVELLNLAKVVPGKYFFVALPLKLKGLDGSPTRAVLLK